MLCLRACSRAAASRASAGSYGGSGGSNNLSPSQILSVANQLINSYGVSVSDAQNGGGARKYGVALDANGNYTRINNPNSLITQINNLPISDDQKDAIVSSIHLPVVSALSHGLVSLSQYMSELNDIKLGSAYAYGTQHVPGGHVTAY